MAAPGLLRLLGAVVTRRLTVDGRMAKESFEAPSPLYLFPDWFSHNIPHLTRVLSKLEKPIRGLEIGCMEGRSSRWFLENGVQDLTCVDTFLGSAEHRGDRRLVGMQQRFRSNVEEFGRRVRVFSAPSDETLLALMDGDRRHFDSFDLVYVDGSHVSRDVATDAILAFRLLRVGGIMVFDDYEWDEPLADPFDGPRPAIDFFCEAFADELEGVELNNQVSVRKVKRRDRGKEASVLV